MSANSSSRLCIISSCLAALFRACILFGFLVGIGSVCGAISYAISSTFRTKYKTASAPSHSNTFKAPLRDITLHPNPGSPSILPNRRGYGTKQYFLPLLVISIIMDSQCIIDLCCLCHSIPNTRSNSASRSMTIASTVPCHPDICTGILHFPYTAILWPPAKATCLATSNCSIRAPAFCTNN